MPTEPKKLDRWILCTALCLFAAFFYYTAYIMFETQWTLDSTGVSTLNQKLPQWDFTNLWTGGYLAREGKLTTIFDILQYRLFLNEHFHVTLAHHEWSYPPQLLLLGAALSTLPLDVAYFVWTIGCWALLLLFLRQQKLELKYLAVAMLSPAIVMNIMIGQNGAMTAFLLLAGLYYSARRPVLGGILLGILTFKPHLCLMLPMALLATRNWRAIAAATITSLSLAGLVTLWLGEDIWLLWHDNTVPFMVNLMQAEHLHPWMIWSITPFYSFREFLPLDWSYALQWLVTGACAAATWNLWRQESLPPLRKAALTGLLALLATPYAHVYDMVVSGMAVALLLDLPGNWRKATLYFLWIVPFFLGSLNVMGLVVTPLVIAVPLVLYYPGSDKLFARFRPLRRPVEGPAA